MDDLIKKFDDHFGAVKSFHEKSATEVAGLGARLTEIEQKMVRDGSHYGEPTIKSLGRQVVDSDEFKMLAAQGGGKIRVKTTITTGSTSGGPLGSVDHIETPDMLQRRKLTVRDLITPGRTDKTSVEYARQTTRTNAAAMQASEGAAKGESALGFELVTAPVRTLAHWIPASVQVLSDVPMLESLIDSELRYGLQDVEENQLLNGTGTGADLNGIYTQATAFAAGSMVIVSPNLTDVILAAMAQLNTAHYEPDGLVLNSLDWRRMQGLKNADGDYLGAGPFTAEQVALLWSLPIATTSAMTAGTFLVGAFKRGSQIFDRQDATVEISTEHSDFFVKNLVAIRAEERLALTVSRPDAFVKGSFATAITDLTS